MAIFELELASRGGAPLFQPFHILKALWYIQQAEIIGRKELSAKLAIGEGSTRKLLTYLEEKGWASSTRQGISLSSSGNKLLDEIGILAMEVHTGDLTVDEYDFAVCLKNASDKVGKGIQQRDEAMKAGATGATTLIYRDRLSLSDNPDTDCGMPVLCCNLTEMFGLESGDVLIVGTGLTLAFAEDGAFAAATVTIF
ncbi:MAG: hypothetical protein KAR56_04650, partial [Thermoplasmata archaeon]|nr:hypothetical protein [Thermoplasmata archaeon]